MKALDQDLQIIKILFRAKYMDKETVIEKADLIQQKVI
jgi:hypothetical protein